MAFSDSGPDDMAIARTLTYAATLAVLAIGLTLFSALTLALFGDLEVRRMTNGPDQAV